MSHSPVKSSSFFDHLNIGGVIEIKYVSNLDSHSMIRSSDSHITIITIHYPHPDYRGIPHVTTLPVDSLLEDDDLCDYVKPVEPLKGLCFI